LQAGHPASLPVPEGHTAAIAVLRGSITVNGSRRVGDAELLVLDRSGDAVQVEAAENTTLLLLSGLPILEPIVGYGPFVMNSKQEIETAISDFQSGRFGRMPASVQ
jgi:redox-sensitive bicupin YhaK (pirin superfamily)